MSIFRKWGRQQRDKDALNTILTSEPPTGAADIPIRAEFAWAGTLGLLLPFLAPLPAIIIFHVVLGFPWPSLSYSVFWQL